MWCFIMVQYNEYIINTVDVDGWCWWPGALAPGPVFNEKSDPQDQRSDHWIPELWLAGRSDRLDP